MVYSKDKTPLQQPVNPPPSAPFTGKPVGGKSVDVRFTGEDISSEGGALLLREVDDQMGLIGSLAGCINDGRDQRYVDHPLAELLAQRVYQIACGYEDGDDCNHLRADPVLKMCSGRTRTRRAIWPPSPP